MRPSARTAPEPSRSTRIGLDAGSGAGDRNSAGPRRDRRRPLRRALRRLPALLVIPVLVGMLGGPNPVNVRADDLSDARARQNALNQQLKDQQAQVAQVAALEADLTSQTASTKRELNGINVDLASVK